MDLGFHVARLLDPSADAAAILKTLLGKESKKLGVIERTGGGSISDSELIVEYSYYGAATGKWEERAPRETEPKRLRCGR